MKYAVVAILFNLILFVGNPMAYDSWHKQTDITHVLDKEQFESVVKYVLDKGKIWEHYSSLWGHSPYLTYKDVTIVLHPGNKSMTIQLFKDLATAAIAIKGDKVYIISIVNIGETEYDKYKDELIKNHIPKMRELWRLN